MSIENVEARSAELFSKAVVSVAEYWALLPVAPGSSLLRDGRDDPDGVSPEAILRSRVEGFAHSAGAIVEGRSSLWGVRGAPNPERVELPGDFSCFLRPSELGLLPDPLSPDFGVAFRMCVAALAFGDDPSSALGAAAREFLSTFSDGAVAVAAFISDEDRLFYQTRGEFCPTLASGPEWERLDPDASGFDALFARPLSDAVERSWSEAEAYLRARTEKALFSENSGEPLPRAAHRL